MGDESTVLQRGVGVPPDAEPFAAFNATAVALIATPQVVKAGSPGKKMWIKSAWAINKTTTEDTFLTLQDSANVGKVMLLPADVDQVTGSQPIPIVFDPPIEIGAGLDLEVLAGADLGDCHVSVTGYTEA